MTRIRFTLVHFLLSIVFLITIDSRAWPATQVTCSAPVETGNEPTQYFVSLADAGHHLAHIGIRVPQADGTIALDMPVWNALYQVRNFSANVEEVRAQDAEGTPLKVNHSSTSEWDINAPKGCVVISYDIQVDMPGPFGAALNTDHGFFNWAMVLMYSPGLRSKPVGLQLLDVPAAWSVRDLHVVGGAEPGSANGLHGAARNYDELVDSPLEAGTFQQSSFQQDGATYHIVVDARTSDYDMAAVQQSLQKITHAAVDWMQDRPYEEYTFLYHFPDGPAAGGMEHTYGTAIDISAVRLRENSAALAEVTAHEFFHLWNVKRIRPQSLEPIDYQHEQDTRALWFSEGVTSTVADMLLVRAGLNTEQQYLAHLGRAITELQQRPAHTWQSVEDSSLEAWLEGSAFYRAPERSISYYNKGEILGILLDLRLRQITQGRKSLRDLFQQMNERYAKQHRFFDDSAGVLEAAEEVVTPRSREAADTRQLTVFFQQYVAGVKEIPYDDFFQFVGLHLVMKSAEVASLGFTTTANIGAQVEVITVEPGSDAEHQGLAKRDRVLELEGKLARGPLEDEIAQKHPGDTISLTISNRAGQREMKLRLGARTERWYELQDLPTVSPAQLAQRTAWMHGDDEDAP